MFWNEERDKRIARLKDIYWELQAKLWHKASKDQVKELETIVLNLVDYLGLELKNISTQHVPGHWKIRPKKSKKKAKKRRGQRPIV